MKVQDSYKSIIRGVSQQAPADRLIGQHGEQVNLISDPVRGLVRRNGFLLQTAAYQPYSGSIADASADAGSFRVYSFKLGTNDYDLLYRSRARVGAASSAHLTALIPVSKFEPRSFMPLVTDPTDTALLAYETGGISAITLLGRYALIAGNTVLPQYTKVDGWNGANQDLAAVYIKTGAYSRTYTVTAKKRSTGQVSTASYTTPVSSYPGTLVTSDLDFGADDYQKLLNDRIYAFQSAQSEWSATSSAEIVPSAIAAKLRDLFVADGFTGWEVKDNYLFHADIETLTVTDGATDNSIEVTHNVVEDTADLSPRHFAGKVVKVQPVKGADEAYYLKATPSQGGTGTVPVTWVETAGDVQTPTSITSLGTIEGNKFYWASTPARLAALVLADAAVTLAPPAFVASTAGDVGSVKPPHFYSTPITLLTVFQDRLVIGSGDTLSFSATGDYLNFYRDSMLSVPATDSFEVYALGTEGDVIRKAALYDRNMTLYGDKYHYVINGRAPIDPQNPSLNVQYTIDGTGRSQPVGNGPYVFVMKEDSNLAAVQLLQLQAGVWQDSPAVNNVTQQLRDYINGTPAEMVALSAPNMLFLRTEFLAKDRGAYPKAKPWGLYVYQYTDTGDNQRAQDSWSSWEWSSALGPAIGISDNTTGDGLLIYTLTFGVNEAGVPTRGVLMLSASARPDPTGMPYLDGLQRATAAETSGLWTKAAMPGALQSLATAVDASRSFHSEPVYFDSERWDDPQDPNYTVGDEPPQTSDQFRWSGSYGHLTEFVADWPDTATDYAWTGHVFPAYVDITNPFMRHQDGKAKVGFGRLVLTKLHVATTRTAGIRGAWRDSSGTKVPLLYKDGYERVAYRHSLFVGRAVDNVQVRIGSVDWLPLTISAISWQGDWHNNQGRTR